MKVFLGKAAYTVITLLELFAFALVYWIGKDTILDILSNIPL